MTEGAERALVADFVSARDRGTAYGWYHGTVGFAASMRIIAFIEDEQLVKKILKHLGLWRIKRKPPPRANGPPAEAFIIYDESASP